jgi:hypothetical protein
MVWLPNAFDFGRHEERRMDVSASPAYRQFFITTKQLLFRGEVAKLSRVV